MSECRWAGSDQPRVVSGRHTGECGDEACSGCQPCQRSHCRSCGREHAAGTCPGCLADMRSDLAEIVRMCRDLPAEVEHRGIDGEAMVLLGPVADAEARGHRAASAAVGRAWVDEADHERHPLTVLGGWRMVVEDAREAPETGAVDVEGSAAYIDRHLDWIGACDWLPAEDLARDLRQCRAHMESVLHDGEQIERGAPCHLCPEGDRPRLVKRYGGDVTGHRDTWHCPKDRNHWWTEAEYRLRVRDDYRSNATTLNATDLHARFGVSRGSVTGWASKGEVRKRGKDGSGRQLYEVADVERMLDETRSKRSA